MKLTTLPELTPKETKIKNLLIKTAKQKTEQIQPLWETTMVDETGRPMAFEIQENYFPFSYEEKQSDIGVYSIVQDQKTQSKIIFGAGKGRQAGVELTPRTDVYKILQEGLAIQELFLKLQPTLFEKGTIFRTKKYQEEAGEFNTRYWTGYIDEMSRSGMSSGAIQTPLDGWLRKGRQNISRGLLDLSFTSTAIQPFAIFDAMGYMLTYMRKRTVFKLVGNLIQAFVRPNFAKNTIEQSVALTTRKGGEEVIASFGLDKLKDGTKLTETKLSSAIKKVTSPFAALQFFDIRTAVAVQKTAVTELSKTMPMDQAQAEADFIMDMVSGSSNIAYRPRIMNQGELGRTLTTFQTFVLNEWGLATQDIIKKGIFKGGVSNSNKTRFWAILGLGFLFLQGFLEDKLRNKITNAVKGTEFESDSFVKSALMFLPERIPVLGNIVSGVKYGRAGISIPLFSVFENIIKGTAGVFTADKLKTKVKNLSKAIEASAILFLGLPGAKDAQNIAERIIEESDIGLKTRKEIAADILEQLKSGAITVKVAEELLDKELGKLERAELKKRLKLEPKEFAQSLLERLKSETITEKQAEKELERFEEANPKLFESKDERSFIDKMVVTAKAIGTDPITAFRFIFTNEKILKIKGGAIIVERLPLEESQAIKKERGATKEMILDHLVPLTIGGSNSEKNLQLVDVADWKRYTPIEIFLGNSLKKKLIDKKKAKQLILDFKSGKISEQDVFDAVD